MIRTRRLPLPRRYHIEGFAAEHVIHDDQTHGTVYILHPETTLWLYAKRTAEATREEAHQVAVDLARAARAVLPTLYVERAATERAERTQTAARAA